MFSCINDKYDQLRSIESQMSISFVIEIGCRHAKTHKDDSIIFLSLSNPFYIQNYHSRTPISWLRIVVIVPYNYMSHTNTNLHIYILPDRSSFSPSSQIVFLLFHHSKILKKHQENRTRSFGSKKIVIFDYTIHTFQVSIRTCTILLFQLSTTLEV